MLSVDPRVPGGVAQFIETLEAHLDDCEITQIPIGSIPGRSERAFSMVLRLVGVPVRVLWLSWFGNHDVIHLNTSLCPKSAVRDALILLALRISRRRNVLLYVHGWEWPVARAIEGRAVLRHLTAFLLRRIGQILVLSPEFRSALCRIGIDAARVGVTTTMFDGRALSLPPPPPSRRRTILFMSRFDRPKGVYELTEGFAQIARRYSDVDLVLAGAGEEETGLHAFVAELGIADRVRFPGYVRGAEKGGLLAACTVYALPSYGGEGMPVALLEALAAGRPVLTTNVGAIPHVVRGGENGIILEAVTPSTIAEALDRMLSDPGWCSQVGAVNRDYARKRFDAARVTADISDVYRSIAGRP